MDALMNFLKQLAITRRAIFRPSGANILNVAQKHSQHLFYYMKKKPQNQKRV